MKNDEEEQNCRNDSKKTKKNQEQARKSAKNQSTTQEFSAATMEDQ